MTKDNQNTIDKLKGDYAALSLITGVTPKYVEMVLTGKRRAKSEKARNVKEAARLYWLFREILTKRFNQVA